MYFKKPNVLIVFSNKEPNQNTLSKDRWTILKISNDLTELTDIAGRKLEKGKEQITQFGAGRVEHEKEKNPQPENEELLEPEQSHQPETVNQHEMDSEMGQEKTMSFKNILFTIRYQPENNNNILASIFL